MLFRSGSPLEKSPWPASDPAHGLAATTLLWHTGWVTGQTLPTLGKWPASATSSLSPPSCRLSPLLPAAGNCTASCQCVIALPWPGPRGPSRGRNQHRCLPCPSLQSVWEKWGDRSHRGGVPHHCPQGRSSETREPDGALIWLALGQRLFSILGTPPTLPAHILATY